MAPRSLLDCTAAELDTQPDPLLLADLARLVVLGNSGHQRVGTAQALLDTGAPELADGSMQLLLKRLAHQRPDQQYNSVTLMCVAMLGDRPGAWVQWARAIALATDRAGGGVLQPSQLFSKFFSTGLPTDAAMHRLWDEQKLGGANKLDLDAGTWYAPQPEVAGVEE